MNVQYETAKTYLRRVREKYAKVERPASKKAELIRRGCRGRIPGIVAKLYFRYGAMNSGKSTALLQAAFNYEERGHEVPPAKPAIDSEGRCRPSCRASGVVAPSTSRSPPAKTSTSRGSCASGERAVEATAAATSAACSSTRSQFLSEGQVDDLLRIAIQQGIPVLAYGIRTDFQTVAFPGSRRLLEIAHSLEELKTICRCGRKAVFNARKVGDRLHLRRRPGGDRRGGGHLRVALRRLLPGGVGGVLNRGWRPKLEFSYGTEPDADFTCNAGGPPDRRPALVG